MAVIHNQQLCRWSAVMWSRLTSASEILRGLPLAAGRRLAVVLLLAYCCSVLARLFWLLLPLPALEQPSDEQLLLLWPTAVEAVSSVVDIQALKKSHLFGSAAESALVPAPVPSPEIEAEETALDLLLLGVVVSDVESSARAVIAHRNQQELFAVGDKLPGGNQVALQQVLPGRIIINNAGRYESLWLYEEENALVDAGRQLTAMALPVSLPTQPEQASEAKPVATEPVSAPVYGAPVTVAKSLADVIKFTPVHAEGKVLGYRVAPGRAPQLFDQFGLQRNDVITGVNGITLDDPTRALKIYRQLQSANSASFELVRDGRTQVIEIKLNGRRGQG